MTSTDMTGISTDRFKHHGNLEAMVTAK